MSKSKSNKQPVGKALPDMTYVGVYLIAMFLWRDLISQMGFLKAISPTWLKLSLVELMMFVPIVVFVFYYKKEVISLLRLNPIKPSIILWSLALTLCCYPVVSFLNVLTTSLTGNAVNDVMTQQMADGSMLAVYFATAIVPPIVEELACRGIVLSALNKSNRRFLAVFISALAFGLIHGNLNQFSYAFVLGLVFALIDEVVDSVYPSIVMHITLNSIPVFLVYYLESLAQGASAADLVTELTGGSVEEAVQVTDVSQIIDQSEQMIDALFPLVILETFMFACIGGVVGFFVFRKIARKCDRWGYIKSLFGCKDLSEYPSFKNQYDLTPEQQEKINSGKLSGNEILELMKQSEVKEPDGQIQSSGVAGDGNAPAFDTMLPEKTHVMNVMLALGILVWIAALVTNELSKLGII